MKRQLAPLFAAIALSPLAQAQTLDITQLNPEVVAAASCQGQIQAVALNNYDLGVLNEERTKAMMLGAVLYEFVILLKEESLEHLQNYQQQYGQIEQNAVSQTLNDIDSGNFTWTSQEEVDVCTAKMVDAITSPLPAQLNQEFQANLRNQIDNRFEAMKNIIEAMQ